MPEYYEPDGDLTYDEKANQALLCENPKRVSNMSDQKPLGQFLGITKSSSLGQ